MASAPAGACEADQPCERCGKDSEFSWNPEERYITPRLSRFYQLGDEVADAYAREDDVELARKANEYLDHAAIYRCNWNYGNAVHDANRYLGLMNLRHRNVDEAARYLVLAGKSTGSPQLDTFGPDLDLANGLLMQGRTDAVKAYLQDIKRFWNSERGEVDRWLAELDQGISPNLDRFAALKPSFAMIALGYAVLAWPAIVTLALLWIGRRTLRRKVLYVVASLAGSYAALACMNWFAVAAMFWLTTTVLSISSSLSFVALYLPLALVFVIPGMVVFAIYKYFARGPSSAAA